MERSLVAILAADVVGYSSMMSIDEAKALSVIKLLREEMFEPEVTSQRGTVAKRLGDGWLVEFPSVVDAVNCAMVVQRKLADIPDINLRIGIHIGDIIHEDGDIYGDGVNIASRLETLSAAGHVLISEDAYRQISGRIDTKFHDVGPLLLKNITQPIHAWSWPEAINNVPGVTQGEQKPGVYVAQFDARGENAEELAEAVKEDLITAFARQTGVNLVTDTEITDYIVAGSIRGSRDRWRISVNLTDRMDDQVVWSERFDEIGDDLFELQDRCVARIAGAVRIRMPSLMSAKLDKRPLEELSVEELLNHAMNCHFSAKLTSWRDADPALNLALQHDPDNWMAMTMLCFNIIARARIFGWRPTNTTDAEKARKLIERAQSLKPGNEVVRMAHGTLLLYVMGDHRAARIEAEDSLKLNSDFYHTISLMSQVELFSGNIDKATELAQRAVNCDPAYPYLHLYQRGAGYVQAVSGQYSDALNSFERADRAAPGLPHNLIGLAISLQLSGNSKRAQEICTSVLEIAPDFNLTEVAAWPFKEPENWDRFHTALVGAGAPLQPPLLLVNSER